MFRFTIRDVLWLTVVVALGLGWVLDHWSSRKAVNAERYLRLAQELDLQHFEHYLLEVPPEDLDLEVLRNLARTRREEAKRLPKPPATLNRP